MTKYIIQRVIWIFIILFTTLTITFMLLKLAPEYPPTKNEEKDTWLEKQVSDGYYVSEYYDKNDPEEVAIFNEIRTTNPGINETVFVVEPVRDSNVLKVFYRVPIPEQYIRWLDNIITDWDWGTSTKVRVNYPAFKIIAERMPITFYLNIATLLFYLPFGFAFGIIAALKKDTIVDNIMQIVIMVFLSVPSLVFILLLIVIFSYKMDGFLPSRFPLVALQSFWEIAQGFVIPVIAAGLPSIAGLTRLLRAELSEVLTSEFVLLAKTKGLSHTQAVLRHAIRNSLVPMVPIIISSFAALLGGSFILEKVYGIPGVGRVTLQALATGNYDYNVIMASSAFYGVIGLVTVLIVDLTYGIIDPQIRMGAKK
ncbi:ABC transporter permease [Mariniplasma anaerobium]|uniref:Peptide ABC transporter permease n=1 Tax=Mariniplasma anaerobium TaxID=2735436 RepID=A0A7U9XV61_9MOLU|nr:ABC transporter permease [Mariniplasma anaerobium]BCR36586.1 peptide ABC transporter permease [Mariniplasma anaerobium]